MDPFFVCIRHNVSSLDDDLPERITYPCQGVQLLIPLLISTHLEGRLDVELFVSVGRDEIDLILEILVSVVHFFPMFDDTNIDRISTADQLVEDNVLHDMGNLLLPEIEAGIPQADID